MTTTNIWWIRRDLRLFDNPALNAALADGAAVVPIFIIDARLWQSDYVNARRIAFMLGGLRELAVELEGRGSRLIIRSGKPEHILPALVEELAAAAVFAQADVSPFARKRDAAVAAALGEKFVQTAGIGIRPLDAVFKDDGDPYVVYTPFKNKWLSLPLPRESDLHPTPERVPALTVLAELASEPIPTVPSLPEGVPFEAGEAAGRTRLHDFAAHGIGEYKDKRNRLGAPGTSRLSPYLRFGMVSAREAAVLAIKARGSTTDKDKREGADTWLSELIWHDFYMLILEQFPHVRRGSFRAEYDGIEWRNDPDEFAAWCEGRTGYPIVDAAMRQLNASGWMHNRGRMIVASFLIKDLLIDWRWGEKFFMQRLVDGDPAANNGGWQWTAGTGTDAAPYFRIFNPVSQGEKFDSKGEYIRQWVPELAAVPDKFIHAPWQMSAEVQEKVGCIIGQHYPHPIVDHKTARERTLAAYSEVKE